MSQPTPEQWVVLYTAANPLEGNIVQGLLRSAGVPAMTSALGHIYVQSTSPVEVLVPHQYLEQAQRILAEAEEPPEPEEGDNGHYGE
jgi:hypothetical protein